MQDVSVRISTKPATFARFIHAFNIDDGESIAIEAPLAQVDFARITGFLSVNSCYALRDVFLKALWMPGVLSERDRNENGAVRVALPDLSLTDGWLWLIVALSLPVTKFRQCHLLHEKAFEIACSLSSSHCAFLSLFLYQTHPL